MDEQKLSNNDDLRESTRKKRHSNPNNFHYVRNQNKNAKFRCEFCLTKKSKKVEKNSWILVQVS